MGEFTRHLSMLSDRAKGQASVWSFGSINDVPVSSTCLGRPGTFHGLVTTDSMVYQPGVPSFRDGFLNYQVGGVHRNWKGELIRGSYDLVLRSESARCLYGFSSAPISATISVLNDNGEATVATTQVSERDGWLKLTARGFSFSKKTIAVKLSQAGASTTNPIQAQPRPGVTKSITCFGRNTSRIVTAVRPVCPAGFTTRAPAKTREIICVKGKTVARITAVNPRCPAGFRVRS
jgi:hypothetical protein